MADETKREISYRLHNEFWLNEIKVKNDALKQLLSINALLMAGYAAILFNINQKILFNEEITYVSAIPKVISSDLEILAKLIGIFVIVFEVCIMLFAVVGPIFFWALSMNRAMSSFTSIYSDTEDNLIDQNFSWKYLKEIAKDKNSDYEKCYNNTLGGIVLIMFVIVIAVFFEMFV